MNKKTTLLYVRANLGFVPKSCLRNGFNTKPNMFTINKINFEGVKVGFGWINAHPNKPTFFWQGLVVRSCVKLIRNTGAEHES